MQPPCHDGVKNQHDKRIERSGKTGVYVFENLYLPGTIHLSTYAKDKTQYNVSQLFLHELTAFPSNIPHPLGSAVFELCFIFMFLFIVITKILDRNYLKEDQYLLAHRVGETESLMEETQWPHR